MTQNPKFIKKKIDTYYVKNQSNNQLKKGPRISAWHKNVQPVGEAIEKKTLSYIIGGNLAIFTKLPYAFTT